MQLAIVVVLAILGFSVIGFVVVVRAIFGKKRPPALGDPGPLTRQDKLAIVEELLGSDMPAPLAEELRRHRLGLPALPTRASQPAVADDPVDAPGAIAAATGELQPPAVLVETPATEPADRGAELGLETASDADGSAEATLPPPTTPPAAADSVAAWSTPQTSSQDADRKADEDADLSDAGLADGLSVPGGRLRVEPEIARLATHARPGLGAFLSFENIIFLLSAVLILGGSLYFAAVTWSRVPGTWQYLFLALITAFYGGLMLVASRILQKRLQLDSAARTLVGIASGVSLLCAAMAAAAFFQSGVAGLVGTAVAAGFALACAAALLRLVDRPVERAPFFAAATALLALAGGAQVLGSGAGAGLAVLAAAALAVALFVPADRELHPLHGLLAAAVPVVGLLLAAPGEIELAHTAPALAALAWLTLAVRARGHRWSPLGGVLLVGLALILSISALGAVAVTALVGVVVLWRAARPPLSVEGKTWDGFALLAGVGASLLWIYLSVAWAPSIGLLLSRESIDWLIDLVTRPGEQVSASWDGLAALPALLLALWESERRRRDDGDRVRAVLAELAGFGVFAVGAILTMATFERQPVPSGIILLLLAAAWGLWSFRRHSALRLTAAHVVLLLGLLSLGSAIDDTWAALLPGLAAVAMAAAPSLSGRSVACLAAPVAALFLAVDGEAQAAWPALIPLAIGVLALWQPGLERRRALSAFGPPLLLLGWLIGLLMDPGGLRDPLLDDDLGLLAAAVFVLGAAAVVAWRRGPRFLTIETNVAALVVGFFGTVIALDHGPGSDETVINGAAALVCMLAFLLTPRGADRRMLGLNWLIVAYALPFPVACFLDVEVAWPGAAAAAAGTAALLFWSRRERAAWLAGFAFVLALIAALWWTLFAATFFSTGGGEERVLTVLGIVATLVGGAVALWGERLSAAGPGLVRGFSVTYLLVALGLGLTGMTAVDQPKGIDVVMALVNLGGVAGFSWFLATHHRRGWLIYLTEAAAIGLYGYLRLRTDLLDGLQGYDGVVMVAGALAFTGLSRLLEDRRSELGLRQTRHVAALLPLVVPFVSEWDGSFSDSLGMGMVSAHYALLARLGGGQRYAWLAALALNVLLFPIWIRHGVETPIAYLMPLGLTLTAMAKLYREALKALAPVLRTLAALLILGSTSLESFAFDTLLPALLLGGLSVGAVLLGVAWRQRAYLYMGFAFLLMDIVVNLTRWGMNSRLIAGTLGVVAGVALFALGVSVARHKEELLRRYRRVQEWEW